MPQLLQTLQCIDTLLTESTINLLNDEISMVGFKATTIFIERLGKSHEF